MTIREAFPDYPLADLPSFPAGWNDSSWKNDSCPSHINAAGTIQVYTDYVDPEKREFPEFKRFTVMRLFPDAAEPLNPEIILESDDWIAVLAFIQTL